MKAIDIHELVVYVWESNSEGERERESSRGVMYGRTGSLCACTYVCDNAANKPYRRHIDEYIARFNKVS